MILVIVISFCDRNTTMDLLLLYKKKEELTSPNKEDYDNVDRLSYTYHYLMFLFKIIGIRIVSLCIGS